MRRIPSRDDTLSIEIPVVGDEKTSILNLNSRDLYIGVNEIIQVIFNIRQPPIHSLKIPASSPRSIPGHKTVRAIHRSPLLSYPVPTWHYGPRHYRLRRINGNRDVVRYVTPMTDVMDRPVHSSVV